MSDKSLRADRGGLGGSVEDGHSGDLFSRSQLPAGTHRTTTKLLSTGHFLGV